ncbi:UNVERIFIED_CONTAM: hypothetical protein HDU68_001720 [Siphonaria sp. JEL0065]|nr:hypothetical protein HDU68_001720 [Siphonaria sp. JEL0065]
MGARDARHIIKTIAHIGRHKEFHGLNYSLDRIFALATAWPCYEVHDSTYEKANRTTGAVDIMKQDGVFVTKWGYFNDMIMGPIISFGIMTEDGVY